MVAIAWEYGHGDGDPPPHQSLLAWGPGSILPYLHLRF